MSPWDLILTVWFSGTGVWCAADLFVHRARLRRADGAVSEHTVIHVGHLVMSAAMILMIWVPVIDIVTWAQAALFGVFAIALLPAAVTRGDVRRRVSLWGHIAMNGAMIWMLLAMPLLMAEMAGGAGGGSSHHAGGGAGMPMMTPAWVDVVNTLFVAVSAASALWWIILLLRRNRHIHDLCYAGMAAGMGLMLIVMNT